MPIDQILIEMANLTTGSPLINLGVFVVSVLAVHHLLKSMFHVIFAAGAGVAFLFVGNNFLGTSFPTDMKTILFFAAAGAVVYLTFALLKNILKMFKK